MSIIHNHPEWEILERYMAQHGGYEYSEVIPVESNVSEDAARVASEIAYRAGEFVADCLRRAAHRPSEHAVSE